MVPLTPFPSSGQLFPGILRDPRDIQPKFLSLPTKGLRRVRELRTVEAARVRELYMHEPKLKNLEGELDIP